MIGYEDEEVEKNGKVCEEVKLSQKVDEGGDEDGLWYVDQVVGRNGQV